VLNDCNSNLLTPTLSSERRGRREFLLLRDQRGKRELSSWRRENSLSLERERVRVRVKWQVNSYEKGWF